ncbi:MAG: hypothetical protein GY864_08910 [Desulfobacterales bacterium]|nr:hypothetical protein [Desulfobacterales bacterium]
MCENIFWKSRTFLWPWLTLVCLLLNSGCQTGNPPVSDYTNSMPEINKLVVAGFRAAMNQGDEPGIVRNPLSDSSFMAAPVPDHALEKMSATLFDRLLAEKKYDLVSPGHVKGRLARIADSDTNIGMDVTGILKKVGDTFGADAVLLGYVYRWRERQGTDYAVKRPASVAFDLYIVRPSNGEIIWASRFDKTQRPLSENILDWATFAESGGKWMTAEKMAILGLEKMFKEMPAGQR